MARHCRWRGAACVVSLTEQVGAPGRSVEQKEAPAERSEATALEKPQLRMQRSLGCLDDNSGFRKTNCWKTRNLSSVAV